jgi:GTP-binding protein Era
MSEKDLPDGSRSGFVALVGWTNVGKSTLLNRLVGVKLAAVGDVAQTTRQSIHGARTVEGRGQIIFVDTPGLHKPRHRMNRAMIHATGRTLGEVDLAALVIDAARGFGPGDRRAAEQVKQGCANRLLVLNKVDLVRPKSCLLPLMQTLAEEDWGFGAIVPVSAKTGEGCDGLIEAILDQLPPGPPLFPEDYLTDQPERVLAAEWIREKLLASTRQELPHATAVIVESWNERDDGLLEIDASILVERTSQKKIVIGKDGQLLKQVGIEARRELESFLDCRIMLRLWVRVREHWRDDEGTLQRLGLS